MSSSSRSWELIIQSAINSFDPIPELVTTSRLIDILALWIQSLPSPHSRQRRSVANQQRIRLDSPWEKMRKDWSYFRVGSPRRFDTALQTAVEEGKCELVQFLVARGRIAKHWVANPPPRCKQRVK
jgi:hypothetical protein